MNVHALDSLIHISDDYDTLTLDYQEAEELLVKLTGILYPPVPPDEIHAGDTVKVPVQARVVSRTIENGKTVNYSVKIEIPDAYATFNPEAVTLVKKNNQKVIVKETVA